MGKIFGLVAALFFSGAVASASTTMVASNSGKCIDIQSKSTSTGAVVDQSTCSGASNQSFTVVPTDSGYYRIQNANSGLCFNVSGRSMVNGGLIIQWTCGVAAQNDQFKAVLNSDGTYSWVGRQSGLCLDVPAHSTSDGVQIDQWTCNGGTNQNFKMTLSTSPGPLPSPSPSPTPPPSDSVRVLQWNVEDGEQADEIPQVVNQKPQIAFLEEVDRVQHIDDIRAALQADQGVPFYKVSVNRDNSPSGASNVGIISRYPLSNVRTTPLNYEGEVICGQSVAARAAIGATISINGKSLAVFGVRTYFDSTSCVSQTQIRRLKTWVNTYYSGMTQLYGGDFNMSPGSAAYNTMVGEAPAVVDSWYEAVQAGTATAYTTVSFTTPTRSSRLDYLFYRLGSTILDVVSAHIPDITPDSDHRQMITNFQVR